MQATPTLNFSDCCRVVFIDRFGIHWGIMTEKTDA